MKTRKHLRSFAGCLLLFVLLAACVLPIAAAEQGTQPTNAPLTPALSVLAAHHEMSVATLCGNDYYFSEDVFARALNTAQVASITVVSLPDVTAGELLMGSERVSAGQSIGAEQLQLLSFVAASDDVQSTSFVFAPADGNYEMTCNVHVLGQINYAPTVSLAGGAALAVSTHRDLVGYGNMTAYDPEGDALIFEVVSAPKNGIVVMVDRANGEYVYLPRRGFKGEDSFCYVARDCYGNYSAAATVSVQVSELSTSVVYADMVDRREYNAALTMTEAGIMQGRAQGDAVCFAPDEPVSRAEFLVMAMKTMGVGSVPTVEKTAFYDDAEISAEDRGYVAAAFSLGYIKGTTDKAGNLCFAPNETVTRAEAAVILSRMVEGDAPEVTPAFADGDDIPAWASEAIATLSSRGILTTTGGAISPNATVTRAQVAAMLCALMIEK